jgi:hypothetical protein
LKLVDWPPGSWSNVSAMIWEKEVSMGWLIEVKGNATKYLEVKNELPLKLEITVGINDVTYLEAGRFAVQVQRGV